MNIDSEIGLLITENQQRIYGYIHSLCGDRSASWDILQETNLVIWRKRDEYEPGSRFVSWAMSIARFQVLAHLRDRAREPYQIMTPDLLDVFGEEPEIACESWDERIVALRTCRQKLPKKGAMLLGLFYDQDLPLDRIASRMGMNANSVKQALFRARRSLQECIETQLPNHAS